MKVGRWRRSSRCSRSSHTKVCILRFLPSGIARNRCGVMFFLFSLNEGAIPLICSTNIRHFSIRASLCLVKSGKMSYFLRFIVRPPENAAVARERRKKKHTSTWSLQGRWTYRARKGRSNVCFGRYLFVLNSPIRCSYRHQPG